MSVAFDKYEGLGNDFLVVRAETEDAVSHEEARRLCDRHFGVGGDGVLLVLPPREGPAVARMRVVNADGSVPEMCGNGLRCVALYLARARGRDADAFTVDTDAGPLACTVKGGEVTLDMGPVRALEPRVIELDGTRFTFTTADAGNPHAVTFEPHAPETIRAFGLRLATHASFPRGANVEFARVSEGGTRIDVTVWERGVGLTLACGTGACATVAVACEAGLSPWDTPVRVHLPAGPLTITMQKRDAHAILTGPARYVFSGAVD